MSEPTVADLWRSLTGGEITDDLLDWPADVFALTAVILERSAAYRFVSSSPEPHQWPPARIPNWAHEVVAVGHRWGAWAEHRAGEPPGLLVEEWQTLRAAAGTPIEGLADGSEWRACEALLTVHAIADEACAGLGIALDAAQGPGCVYRAQGRELLARTGSLSRIPTHQLRVLPKVRTAPSGTSANALSRYACVLGPNVDVHWHKLPTRRPGIDPGADHVNILLLPWPLRVRESDFRPVEGSVQRRTNEPFGLFEFAPSEGLDLDLLDRTLVAACDEVDSVDIVYLPESAVDAEEIAGLEEVLDRHGVIVVSAGIRERARHPNRLPGNWVHIGVNPRLHKGTHPRSTGEPWIHIRQNKHHRWSLNESQIYQYHLGGALHPDIRWWEAIEVPRQSLNFLEVGEGIVVVYLVCEDLAKSDDVAEVVRKVGPTVVTTLVNDGPQLSSRWGARYASVLADDPGSAVLTLTSYGMVQRSRPRGRNASSVIAMWKDPTRGIREIPLESGAHGVLLTGCTDGANRRCNDSRWPVDNSTHFFDVATHQVRASDVGTPSSPPATPATAELEAEELTILTSWAEALAEVLVVAPERTPATLLAARAGAAWRAALGIEEPSPQLAQAIESMQDALRTVDFPDGRVPIVNPDPAADAHGLADRVLQYACDSRAARRARQDGGP
jgi:hypothetical protein